MRTVILLTTLAVITGWIAHAGFLSASASPAAPIAVNASQLPREFIGRISPPANTEAAASPPPSLTQPQRITQLETGPVPLAVTAARQDYWARFRARPAREN